MAATDKDKVMKKFTDRLQLRFDNVQRAWHHIRRTVPADGVISANQFYRMIDQVFSIGMSEKEIHEMIRILDKDKNGVIDFNEFQTPWYEKEGALVLTGGGGALLAARHRACRALHSTTASQQVNQQEFATIRTGLPVSKSIAQEQGTRGKGSAFHYDRPVSFNNPYRQTLDESGLPILKNIFAGVFTSTDKISPAAQSWSLPPRITLHYLCFFSVAHAFQACRKISAWHCLPPPAPLKREATVEARENSAIPQERATGKKWVAPSNLEYCEHNVPMVQGVLQGVWYGDKSDMREGQPRLEQERNCIQEHRKIINGYSQVLKALKPSHRKSPPPSLRSTFASPTEMQDTVELPTSAQEVEDLYGRTDPKAAQSMVLYLEQASPKERNRFMKTLQGRASAGPGKSNPNADMLLRAMEAVNAAHHGTKGIDQATIHDKKFLRRTQVRVGGPTSRSVARLPRPSSSLGTLIPRHVPAGSSAQGISPYGRPSASAAASQKASEGDASAIENLGSTQLFLDRPRLFRVNWHSKI